MEPTNNEPLKRWWLYVLELEKDKFYVGITSKTPEARMQEHINGFLGANWTKHYKPIRILDKKDLGVTTKSRAEAYENKVTRKYIKQYGLDSVRGGDLSYDEKLVVHRGRVFKADDWETITFMVLLMLIIFYLIIS